MENELKPFWRRYINFNWKFGLILILLVCIPRFILVLNANATGNYGSIGQIMMFSAIVPFVFLTKHGLKEIGVTKPKKYNWLIFAFLGGLIASILLYALGQLLYGNSYENWYEYIAKSYNKNIPFVIMALIVMTFSPFGEELFFRGIVHASFTKSIGEKKASLIDSSAFALTHISHFGLVFINNKWDIFIIPSIIWVASMFLVSLLFYSFRKKTGSILGAILCHSGFNLGMIFCIYHLP